LDVSVARRNIVEDEKNIGTCLEESSARKKQKLFFSSSHAVLKFGLTSMRSLIPGNFILHTAPRAAALTHFSLQLTHLLSLPKALFLFMFSQSR
jgi:hypothetical protein